MWNISNDWLVVYRGNHRQDVRPSSAISSRRFSHWAAFCHFTVILVSGCGAVCLLLLVECFPHQLINRNSQWKKLLHYWRYRECSSLSKFHRILISIPRLAGLNLYAIGIGYLYVLPTPSFPTRS